MKMKQKNKRRSKGKKSPILSIILPVYNEEKKIKSCLDSIFFQNFDRNLIEVLIIDDGSNDKTLEIAEKYPVKILKSGKKDYDISKSIGVKNARGKFLFFIDADNRLVDKNWFSKGIKILKEKNKVIGIQSWKFHYSKSHNTATRYQDLFGNTDPAVFYLKRQDHLQYYENEWNLNGKVVENNQDYILVKFRKNEVPTLGSQGFLTRKEYFENENIFQHIEFFIKKSEEGYFCFLKNDIEHLPYNSIHNVVKRLERNITHYFSDKKKKEQERYNLNLSKMIKVFFIMISIIIPFYDSLKGYFKVKDKAWLLHIYFSFLVAWIYAWKFLKFKLKG